MGRTYPPPETSGRLDDRVLVTLQGLHGRIAFGGLRRALRAHPESLSRALRRLEREGLVERADGGYRATTAPPRLPAKSPGELRTIAQVELPPNLSASTILGRLAGRWFGSLRWVGTIDRPDGPLLAWGQRDGGGIALLGLRKNVLRIYLPEGAEADDPAEAEEMAYELLAHAVDALRPSPTVDGKPSIQSFTAPSEAWPADN
jgi:hypothetical protein